MRWLTVVAGVHCLNEKTFVISTAVTQATSVPAGFDGKICRAPNGFGGQLVDAVRFQPHRGSEVILSKRDMLGGIHRVWEVCLSRNHFREAFDQTPYGQATGVELKAIPSVFAIVVDLFSVALKQPGHAELG